MPLFVFLNGHFAFVSRVGSEATSMVQLYRGVILTDHNEHAPLLDFSETASWSDLGHHV